MEYSGPDRRRETRYPITAEVVIEREATRQTISAKSRDISGGGILLLLDKSLGLKVGEKLVCEVRLPRESSQMLPEWGIGTVVRVDNEGAAVEFRAASFPEPEKG